MDAGTSQPFAVEGRTLQAGEMTRPDGRKIPGFYPLIRRVSLTAKKALEEFNELCTYVFDFQGDALRGP